MLSYGSIGFFELALIQSEVDNDRACMAFRLWGKWSSGVRHDNCLRCTRVCARGSRCDLGEAHNDKRVFTH